MSAANSPIVSPQRIMEMAWGYAPPLILTAALSHRFFDLIEERPKNVEELASASGCAPRGVRSIANALVGFGFLSKDSEGRYSLTPESATFLVKNKPGYIGGFIEYGGRKLIHGWLNIEESTRTGKPAFAVNQQQTGDSFFQELVEPIFAMSYPATQVLRKALGLENEKNPIRVLDIGAGSGVWGIGLAQLSPNVSVTAVDWPGVLDVTRRVTDRFGMADRFSYIPGDFLAVDYGTGYNVITIGHILHSEGEERSRQLLKKCATALAPGGTVAVAEMVVNEDRTGPAMNLIFGVNMMLHTDVGDTYTFGEISGWMKEAGLVNTSRVETGGPVSIVLGQKPK